MLRLNLGCGNNLLPDYVNIDKYDVAADVMADVCELPYENESVDQIVAYQVIEHLPYWKTDVSFEHSTDAFWLECYRVLKPGGEMITECPDIELIAQRIAQTGDVDYTSIVNIYGEYYRPWDTGRYPDWEHQAGSLHINGFTWKRIQRIAERIGFSVERQEMGDKHPNYHFEENLSVKWTK